MHHVLQNIQLLATTNIVSTVLLIYIATSLFGNIISFTSFWLAYRGMFGAFGMLEMAALMFFADITADMLWYTLGRKLSHTRLGCYIKKKLPRHEKIERFVHEKTKKIILTSKFVYGSAFPVTFLVGWTKVDFKRFIKLSAKALALWVPTLGAISFLLFSTTPLIRATHLLRRMEFIFVGFLVIFIAFDLLISLIIKKRFESE